MLKRIVLCLLAVVTVAFCCTSCDSFGSVEQLLTPPRSGGELYDIQQALYNFAGRSVKLHYAHTGDNRSAFIRSDLDSDGVNEAVAFYSVANADGVAEIHINIIDTVDGGWVSVCDTATGASGIDKVEIAPLSEKGAPVLAVGAELFSATANQISLFTYSNGHLYTRMKENYTRFLICDLAGVGYDQLVLLNHNSAERSAEAQVYSVGADYNTLLGAVSVDGNISGVTAFNMGKLTDGRAALFIDSAKSTSSTITDLVYFEGESLKSEFFDKAAGETTATLRYNTLLCADINGDGTTDIPFAKLMPGYENMSADERMYLTIWRSFDGKKYADVLAGDFNYDGGYYFEFPTGWLDKVTLVYDKSTNMHSYRLWNAEHNSALTEIVRLRCYSAAEYEDIQNDQLIELMRDDSRVWAARLIMTDGEYALDKEKVTDCFGKGEIK